MRKSVHRKKVKHCLQSSQIHSHSHSQTQRQKQEQGLDCVFPASLSFSLLDLPLSIIILIIRQLESNIKNTQNQSHQSQRDCCDEGRSSIADANKGDEKEIKETITATLTTKRISTLLDILAIMNLSVSCKALNNVFMLKISSSSSSSSSYCSSSKNKLSGVFTTINETPCNTIIMRVFASVSINERLHIVHSLSTHLIESSLSKSTPVIVLESPTLKAITARICSDLYSSCHHLLHLLVSLGLESSFMVFGLQKVWNECMEAAIKVFFCEKSHKSGSLRSISLQLAKTLLLLIPRISKNHVSSTSNQLLQSRLSEIFFKVFNYFLNHAFCSSKTFLYSNDLFQLVLSHYSITLLNSENNEIDSSMSENRYFALDCILGLIFVSSLVNGHNLISDCFFISAQVSGHSKDKSMQPIEASNICLKPSCILYRGLQFIAQERLSRFQLCVEYILLELESRAPSSRSYDSPSCSSCTVSFPHNNDPSQVNSSNNDSAYHSLVISNSYACSDSQSSHASFLRVLTSHIPLDKASKRLLISSLAIIMSLDHPFSVHIQELYFLRFLQTLTSLEVDSIPTFTNIPHPSIDTQGFIHTLLHHTYPNPNSSTTLKRLLKDLVSQSPPEHMSHLDLCLLSHILNQPHPSHVDPDPILLPKSSQNSPLQRVQVDPSLLLQLLKLDAIDPLIVSIAQDWHMDSVLKALYTLADSPSPTDLGLDRHGGEHLHETKSFWWSAKGLSKTDSALRRVLFALFERIRGVSGAVDMVLDAFVDGSSGACGDGGGQRDGMVGIVGEVLTEIYGVDLRGLGEHLVAIK
jgi:hypothetical protein